MHCYLPQCMYLGTSIYHRASLFSTCPFRSYFYHRKARGRGNVVRLGEVWEGNQNKNSKLFNEAYNTHGFCVGVGRYTCSMTLQLRTDICLHRITATAHSTTTTTLMMVGRPLVVGKQQ